MADKEEGEQTNPRGNDWEVVSLTASAYAASPGPDGIESIQEDNNNSNSNNNSNGSEAEASQSLFMSGHFVFPPNEHENLPIDPNVEIQKEEKEAEQIVSETFVDESISEHKGDEKFDILSVSEVLQSIYDDKDNNLTIHGPDFNDDKASTEASAMFSSFSGARAMRGSIYDENVSSNVPSPPEPSLDPSDGPHGDEKAVATAADNDKLPPGAWWRRQVSSLCAHAKETNTFWSIFIAAAVMGLVMLGKQWQQERWQVMQQRWHASVNAEKPGKMLAPLSRFKDIFIGQRTSQIRNGLAADH